MFFIKRRLKVKRPKVDIEPQEILLDSLTQKEEGQTYQLEVPLRKRTVFVFWLSLVIFLGFIFVRIFQLQIVKHSEYMVLADKNQYILHSIQSQRGVIYDSNLEQIVFNKPVFNLICLKDKIGEDIDKILKRLSLLLKVDSSMIKEEIEKSEENEVLVIQGLDYQSLIIFEGLSEEFPAFFIESGDIREYRDGYYSSHIIGYYRRSGQSTGIENYYNDVLSSDPGKIVVERDAKGRIISEEVESLGTPGDSLILWMESDLQKKLYSSLKNQLDNVGSSKGLAVAMDPNTGGILSLVSIPGYDNNLFSHGISQEKWDKIQNDEDFPLLNRVISAKYPTGSTIKPLIAAAGLEEGIIDSNTTVNCQGKLVRENPWDKDNPFVYNDWTTHGITDVEKAIAESCNVFFYTIGGGYEEFKGLGVDKIKEYLTLFGWGEGLDLDLPGNISGFIPDREWKEEKFSSPDNIWYPGDTYNLAIGQGYIGITPLEVVSSFSAIANGGKLLEPQIVKEIIDENKNVIEEFEPQIIRENFIQEENLNIVRKGMREAVIYGSSTLLGSLPVKAAAKTGTAEISKKGYYHNWVTVFAPYNDPEIVLTIMAEDVKGIQAVALPVAKDVLNWYFTKDYEE